MAELSKNGLWSDIQSGAENVEDRLFGPSADYVSMIPTPAQQGVGQNGDIGQLVTNAKATFNYVGALTTGPLVGNAQFVETGGMCKTPGGAVVPRWSYVNNRSSGTDVMPQKIKDAIGGGVLDGIIPGMFGDIADLNPLTTMNGLYLDGVPPCEAITCPVTYADGTSKGMDTRFLTYGLEQNLNSCVTADEKTAKDLEVSELAKIEEAKSKEAFGGLFAPAPFSYGPVRMVKSEDSTPYIGWGLAILILVGVLAQKTLNNV